MSKVVEEIFEPVFSTDNRSNVCIRDFLTLNITLYRFNRTVIDRIIVIPFILIACSILQYLSIHYIHHCFFIMACYETNLKLLTTFISHIVCLRRTKLLLPIRISTLQLSL